MRDDRLLTRRLELSRRHLLSHFGGAAATALAMPLATPALAQPFFFTSPFQLGIASGDPAPDGFVIWTRLAPDPFAIGYGMPSAAVEVGWEVSGDAAFAAIVQQGTALARPELGHSVHVEVTGLMPERPYWYRFTAGRERSFVGRAVTTPAPGAQPDRARFAVAGCQHYETGFFTAHRRLAQEEDLDFVFCYGDYIYESRGEQLRMTSEGPVPTVREHLGDEPVDLAAYRRRYAQYKMDPDLQAAHLAAPWFAVWDDHETDNNWASQTAQDDVPPEVFALRRQAAAQAYYEHMPLRASAFPIGTAIQIYRQARYGNLLDLNLLDTRQYRTDQPCGDRWNVECEQINDPNAQMMGERQHDWLMDNVARSESLWQVIAQQVMVMDLDRRPGDDVTYNLDSWAGYRAPRERMLEGLHQRKPGHIVILTGDEHRHYAGEVQIDGQRPAAEPVAVEFVTTSITSGGDGEDQPAEMARIQAENEQLKFTNSQRGYAVCDVSRERWQTEMKVLDKVSVRDGTLSTRKLMTVLPGEARLHEA